MLRLRLARLRHKMDVDIFSRKIENFDLILCQSLASMSLDTNIDLKQFYCGRNIFGTWFGPPWSVQKKARCEREGISQIFIRPQVLTSLLSLVEPSFLHLSAAALRGFECVNRCRGLRSRTHFASDEEVGILLSVNRHPLARKE